MRSILIPVVLVALAAVVVSKAFQGVPTLLAAAVEASPAPAPRPAAAPASMQVVPVDNAQFRDVQKQQASLHGAVVLDLERLESVDAAQTLALNRSEVHPAGAPLVCWLAARDAAEAAAASVALARAGCTKLRVVA
jgi:hypothetical protein